MKHCDCDNPKVVSGWCMTCRGNPDFDLILDERNALREENKALREANATLREELARKTNA